MHASSSLAARAEAAASLTRTANDWYADGRAFAWTAVGMSAAGLLLGVGDVIEAPHDDPWMRGASIALLVGGLTSGVIAALFHVGAEQHLERAAALRDPTLARARP